MNGVTRTMPRRNYRFTPSGYKTVRNTPAVWEYEVPYRYGQPGYEPAMTGSINPLGFSIGSVFKSIEKVAEKAVDVVVVKPIVELSKVAAKVITPLAPAIGTIIGTAASAYTGGAGIAAGSLLNAGLGIGTSLIGGVMGGGTQQQVVQQQPNYALIAAQNSANQAAYSQALYNQAMGGVTSGVTGGFSTGSAAPYYTASGSIGGGGSGLAQPLVAPTASGMSQNEILLIAGGIGAIALLMVFLSSNRSAPAAAAPAARPVRVRAAAPARETAGSGYYN